MLAAEDRVEKLSVHVGVGPYRGLAIGARSRCRILGLQVHGDPDRVAALCAIGPNRLSMREEQVLRDARALGQVATPRCQGPFYITTLHHDPRLVQGDPQLDAITERAVEQTGVVREPVGDVAVRPSPPFIQGHRQVPVIKGYYRRDAVIQQPIHEALVEREPLAVDAAAPLRQHPAPTHAEPIRSQAELPHQAHVVRKAPVVVTGKVAGLAVRDGPGGMGEAMPDARPGAVGQGRALDLIGRGRRAPQEPWWKAGRACRGRTRVRVRVRPGGLENTVEACYLPAPVP